jgi:hypothetical protein
VNGTAVLLALVASLLTARAIERDKLEAVVETEVVQVARRRAAA